MSFILITNFAKKKCARNFPFNFVVFNGNIVCKVLPAELKLRNNTVYLY